MAYGPFVQADLDNGITIASWWGGGAARQELQANRSCVGIDNGDIFLCRFPSEALSWYLLRLLVDLWVKT